MQRKWSSSHIIRTGFGLTKDRHASSSPLPPPVKTGDIVSEKAKREEHSRVSARGRQIKRECHRKTSVSSGRARLLAGPSLLR